MGSQMIGRPHNSEDQPHRNQQTPVVHVDDLDVIFGDDGDLPDDHVTTGEGETHDVLGRRMLVELGQERLGSTGSGLGGLVGVQHRPTRRVESDVGGLPGPVDGDVVLARNDHCPAEAVPAELNRHSLPPVDQFFGLVGERETTASVDFGEPLVLGGLLVPFPPGTLAELRGEIGVGLTSVIHGFSRSRHPTSDTG